MAIQTIRQSKDLGIIQKTSFEMMAMFDYAIILSKINQNEKALQMLK